MKKYLKWGGIGVCALIVLIVIIAVTTNGNKTTPTAATATQTNIPSPYQQHLNTSPPTTPAPPPTMQSQAPPPTRAPTTQAPPPPTTQAPAPPPPTQAPAMTVSEQQAVDSAQNYLDLGSGFSYEGLLKQLTSSYGDGDTTSDAKFAINYLQPNWDQQAVESAKSYLALGSGFSKSSLYQQLTSSYGSGFTSAQANYALSKVGM